MATPTVPATLAKPTRPVQQPQDVVKQSSAPLGGSTSSSSIIMPPTPFKFPPFTIPSIPATATKIEKPKESSSNSSTSSKPKDKPKRADKDKKSKSSGKSRRYRSLSSDSDSSRGRSRERSVTTSRTSSPHSKGKATYRRRSSSISSSGSRRSTRLRQRPRTPSQSHSPSPMRKPRGKSRSLSRSSYTASIPRHPTTPVVEQWQIGVPVDSNRYVEEFRRDVSGQSWTLFTPDWGLMENYQTGYMTTNLTTRGFERELYATKVIEHINCLIREDKAPGKVFYVKMEETGYHFKYASPDHLKRHWTVDFATPDLKRLDPPLSWSALEKLEVYHFRMEVADYWQYLLDRVNETDAFGNYALNSNARNNCNWYLQRRRLDAWH